MDQETVNKVAWVGWRELRGPVRGVVLRFSGLGASGMHNDPDPMDLEWGDAGALVVCPYHDPWAWMNPATRAFVDDLLAALYNQFALAPHIPIISTGGSMGGHGALTYALYAARPVAACMALYPVCDLPYHYMERADLPRTMHHAFGSYGCISSQLEANSPLHQVDKMPRIPYLFVHGEKDASVAKSFHSDLMVRALREQGHQDIDYVESAELGHGGPMTWDINRRIMGFVKAQLL